MKLFEITLILIVALSQLCAASEDFSEDKSFPLFDYLTTKANEYYAADLVETGVFFANVWTQFKEEVLSKGTEDHKFFEGHTDYNAFEEAIHTFAEAAEKLTDDQENCALQKDASEKLAKMYDAEPTWNLREFDKYEVAVQEQTLKLNIIRKSMLEEIIEEVSTLIKTIDSALSDEEKQHEYKEFVYLGQMFLSAETYAEKQIILLAIAKLPTKDDFNGMEQCKWNFDEYSEAIDRFTVYVDDVVPHFEAKANLVKLELQLWMSDVAEPKEFMETASIQYREILGSNCTVWETTD